MKINFKRLFISAVVLLIVVYSSFADVRLPKLVSDGMILQRETPVKIWGWADAGEKVNVKFNNQTIETITSTEGKWSVMLAPQKAGGPFEMTISGKNQIHLENILFGDVWFCSGQSNMETTLSRVSPLYEKEIETSANPEIRLFQVPVRWNFTQAQNDIQGGKWEEANPQNILKYTAVGYFFARGLYEKYKIPLGIIQCAAGGSAAESWISEETLRAFPEQHKIAEQLADSAYLSNLLTSERIAGKQWTEELNKNDKSSKLWASPEFDDSEWSVFQLPGNFKETIGFESGVIWFRNEIELPENCAGKPAYLEMGRIVDSDSVFVNGIFVGSVSYQYPPRRYNIESGILKPGKNLIAVRIVSQSANGGFIKDKPYQLTIASQKYDLKGSWKYSIAAKAGPAPVSTFLPSKPLGLFNAMLIPANNYTIKGVVWYQGETNAERPAGYAEVLKALIAEWRSLWNNSELPFLCVQLPEFMEAKAEPSESDWAVLRNEQLKILTVPNTSLIVTLGLGEWNDIHPMRKKEVSERLLLAAMKNVYGEKNRVASGPIYKSMKVKGNKIEISFTECGSGLKTADGKEPKYFAIAGTDQKFVWAKAEIRKNKVIVWSEKVQNPVVVRYAWADNPEGANLCNKEGLPASPFTTK
ncbi:MAG: sialate O-acetylesterase [Draconibacterium sp.]